MEGRWMDELVNRWVENRQQSWMNAGRGFMKGCLEAEGTEGTEGGQGQWWGTTAMGGGGSTDPAECLATGLAARRSTWPS